MVWAWAGAVAIVVAAVASGVAIANATVFSASSFARDYLDALVADRIDEVRALPGVLTPRPDGRPAPIDATALDSSLLVDGAGEPFAYEIRGEDVRDGIHVVNVAFGPDADHMVATTTLAIERVGSRFLLFPRWGFAAPPVSTVTVALSGDARFTVGDLPVEAEGRTAELVVLRPGIYRLAHKSEFLGAEPVLVAAAFPEIDAALAIGPSERFRSAVVTAVDELLSRCTDAPVLFPPGCPFGHAITDRVLGEPEWSIPDAPEVEIGPGAEPGLWRVTHATGVAQLDAEVQDLFDGEIRHEVHKVPFTASYDIAFDGDRVVLLPR